MADYIEYKTEKDIRAWIDAEVVRLGEWFNGFLITWYNSGDYRYGQLYLWSESKYDFGKMKHPYGRGLMVAEVFEENGLYLETIQHKGRELYYKLKKDYPVHRDLRK